MRTYDPLILKSLGALRDLVIKLKPFSALVIVAATAVSYIAAYFFEVGFLEANSVPKEFAQVSTLTLITTAVGMATIAYLIITYAHILANLARINTRLKRVVYSPDVFKWTTTGLIGGLMFWLLNGSKFELLFLTIVILSGVALVLTLIVPLFGMLIAKLRNRPHSDNNSHAPTSPSAITLLDFVFIIVSPFFFAYSVGYGFGSKPSYYMTFNEKKSGYDVIIRSYGDTYIVRHFSTNKGEFNEGFYTVQSDEVVGVIKERDVPSRNK